MLSSIMDGDKLAKKCNLNLCNICVHNSDMAVFARQAIETPILPPPSPPLSSGITTPTSSVATPSVVPCITQGDSDDATFEPLEITSSVGRQLDHIATKGIFLIYTIRDIR